MIRVTTTTDLYNKNSNVSHAKWHSRQMSIESLNTHILSGYAFAVGDYVDSRRTTANFISSSIIALDIDGVEGTLTTLGDLVANDFIRENAGLIYATPSWKPELQKWRVIFYLSSPITSASEYSQSALNLYAFMQNFIIGIDTVTHDGARFFYGSDLKDRMELTWQSDNRLSLDVLGNLPKSAVTVTARKKSLGKRQIIIPTEIKATKAMKNRIPKQLMNRVVALSQAPLDRNPLLYKLACDMNDAGVDYRDAYPVLYAACIENGYITEQKWLNTFNGTFRSAFGNIPDHSDVSWMNEAYFEIPFLKNAYPNHLLQLDKQYITDMDSVDFERMMSYSVVLVKSPTGSGKTTMFKMIHDSFHNSYGRAPRMMIISHRKSLVNKTADTLGFATYENDDFSGSVVTTIDSLHKYNPLSSEIEYDIIVLDEASQSLWHLANSSTLRSDRLTPQQILESYIRNAKQFFAMDANLNDESAKWIEQTSSRPVLRVYNAGKPAKRNVTVWQHASAIVGKAIDSAFDGFTALGCVSKSQAHTVERLAQRFGLKTLCVTSETTSNAELEALLYDINNVDLQLLIYTSSLGTGIDITRPCKNAFLMAIARPLTGEELVQMISRVRHAEMYHVQGVAKSVDDHNIIMTPKQLYADLMARNQYKTANITEMVLKSANLHSLLKSAQQREFSNAVQSFVASAIQNGFYFVTREVAENDRVKALMKECHDIEKAWKKDVTLTLAPISDDEKRAIVNAKQNTRPVTYANNRYHIESMIGEQVSDDSYEAMSTELKRKRLMNLANSLSSRVDALLLDQKHNEYLALQDTYPILKRQEFFVVLLNRMGVRSFGDFESIQDLTEEQLITPELKQFIDSTKDNVRVIFGRYKTTDNYVTELRAILREYSIKITSRKVQEKGTRKRDGNGKMSKGNHINLYSIDAESLWQALDFVTKINQTRGIN